MLSLGVRLCFQLNLEMHLTNMKKICNLHYYFFLCSFSHRSYRMKFNMQLQQFSQLLIGYEGDWLKLSYYFPYAEPVVYLAADAELLPYGVYVNCSVELVLCYCLSCAWRCYNVKRRAWCDSNVVVKEQFFSPYFLVDNEISQPLKLLSPISTPSLIRKILRGFSTGLHTLFTFTSLLIPNVFLTKICTHSLQL